MKILILFILVTLLNTVHAEITTDGSMGAIVNLSGNMTIPQTLGITQGNNLFHSFNRFNINTGESATFTGDNQLKNVISRVTGGQHSTINGLLKSSIPNANFYFINPAGITFAENAQIDVPAAFYISTANTIKFADGSQFNTTDSNINHLSIAEPTEFGFINTSSGNIEIQRSDLQFKQGSSVALAANNIILNSGRITNPSGTLQLSATETLQLDNSILSSDSHNTVNAGNITVNTNKLTANNSTISSSTYNSGNAGTININSPSITLNNASIKTHAAINSQGDAGKIQIKANDIQLKNTSNLDANTRYTAGRSGDITIETSNLYLDKFSSINSDNNDGQGGNTTIKSNNITLKDGGYIAINSYGTGNSGKININNNNTILIDGADDNVKTPLNGVVVSGWFSGIYLNTYGSGNGGNLELNTKNLTQSDGGLITAFAVDITSQIKNTASTLAGNLLINAENLNLQTGGKIGTTTFSAANAGSVQINTKNLQISGKFDNTLHPNLNIPHETDYSGILSNASRGLNPNAPILGNGGSVSINADSILLNDNGLISVSTLGDNQAGNIKINTTDLTATNQGKITSDTRGSGNAGDIYLNSKNINLTNGGYISTITYDKGHSGEILIHNTENILIEGADDYATRILNDKQVNGWFSGIYLNTYGSGNGGNLELNTKDLTQSNGGLITAFAVDIVSPTKNTENTSAGNLLINADTLNLKTGGKIATTTFSAANAGSIQINANDIQVSGKFNHAAHPNIDIPYETDYSGILSNASRGLNPNALNLGSGGSVLINADTILLNDGGLVNVSTKGDKKAGIINMNANHHLIVKNTASISSSTAGIGSAGNINITSPLVILDNASISAEAAKQSQGQTGNIAVTATKAVILNNQAKISLKNEANAINPRAIIPSSITITAPDINLTNSKITTEATGNVDASDININFSHWLTLDPSFITTTANSGNGGDININGGQLVYLKDSGFLTSVSGINSNGGNIKINSDYLVMDTGVIQSNAINGRGGNIDLNLKYALIPSYNRLILGGQKINWLPFSGLNIIQAASDTGINGVINKTTPQFDINTSISGLKSEQLTISEVDISPCKNLAMRSSGLSRFSKGSIPNNETQYGFIPPVSSTISTEKQIPDKLNNTLSCKNL